MNATDTRGALDFELATRRRCSSDEQDLGLVAPNKVGPYILKQTIGRGSFSVVKVAVHSETNEQFACKIIPKKRLLSCGIEDHFEREIRILQRLKHPGICQLLDILKDTLNYYIILELCTEGTLLCKIVNEKRLREDAAKDIFKQIVEALQYIHNAGICHRDIKPENILMTGETRIKIIDFGLSNFQQLLVNTHCGSASYASPECMSHNEYDGKKSDMWSLGVVLYTMLSGRLPWSKQNRRQMLAQVMNGEYFLPPHVSEPAQDLIHGLINVDVSKRWTIDQVIACEWLRDARTIAPLVIPSVPSSSIDEFFDTSRSDAVVESEARHILSMARRRAITCRRIFVPRLRVMSPIKNVC